MLYFTRNVKYSLIIGFVNMPNVGGKYYIHFKREARAEAMRNSIVGTPLKSLTDDGDFAFEKTVHLSVMLHVVHFFSHGLRPATFFCQPFPFLFSGRSSETGSDGLHHSNRVSSAEIRDHSDHHRVQRT